MLLPLLLLGDLVCLGSSYDQIEYGKTHRMLMPSKAYSIDFRPQDRSEVTVLWNRDNPAVNPDSRRQVIGSFYVMSNVTQRDSGQYTIRDKKQRELSAATIQVIENKEFYSLTTGDKLNISFDLESNSCSIYFFPKRDHEELQFKTEIVRRGRLRSVYHFDCEEFDLLEPCGILNVNLQSACRGRFEIRDQNNDVALTVELEMDKVHKDPLYTAIGVSGFIAALIACCCVRCCCCRKRSNEKHDSEAAAEPAASFCEYDNSPAGGGGEQLSQPLNTHYPAAPLYTPTGPLVHEPPTVPPTHSEVPAPAEPAGAADVPLFSDPEPRFELKGMSSPFALPLSSESTYSDVYTSDKFTFHS